MRTEADQLAADLALKTRDGTNGDDHYGKTERNTVYGYLQNGPCNGVLTAGINRQAIGYE